MTQQSGSSNNPTVTGQIARGFESLASAAADRAMATLSLVKVAGLTDRLTEYSG